jgi:ABC-type lipoprotein release transport system permease subunit
MNRFGVLFRLAIRNLRRQTRRSLLSAFAMIIGLGLLVMSRAMAEGGHEDWIEAGVRLGSGHISLEAPEFRARKTIDYRLGGEELEAISRALEDSLIAPVKVESTVRLDILGLASSASAAVPAMISAVDPARESRFSRLQEKLVDGRYLGENDRLHAYVGEKLAERLDLEVGSRLVLTAQDANGEIAGQLVRVAGIFRTGVPETDEGFIQIPLWTAREWLVAESGATSVALLLTSSRAVAPVMRRLRSLLTDGADGIDVLSWRAAMPTLDAAVRMDDFYDYVFHVITLIIVALAIVNTVLMSVLFRTREFGVVRAIGLTRGETGAQVLLEGFVLTTISGFAGILVGLGLTWALFRNGFDFAFMMDEEFQMAGVVFETVIYPQFHYSQLLWSLVFIFVVAIVASLYPAYRATKIDISDAMKFEQ